MDTHGLHRLLRPYADRLVHGLCDPAGRPAVVRSTVATALVDGCNGLGQVVAGFAMDTALALARQAGSGWVTVHNSNHFGTSAPAPIGPCGRPRTGSSDSP